MEQCEQKHVVLVDDEATTYRQVARALREGGEDIRVTYLADGAQALPLLERERVDLLITALVMPVVDGIELLRQVANRRRVMPVIVMADCDPPAPARPSAIHFVREPIRAEQLAVLIAKCLTRGPDRAGLSVADLAQMIAMARRSCALRVQRGEVAGTLVFAAGVLVDAVLGDGHGDAAADELLAWDHATMRIDGLARTRQHRVTVELAALLRASEAAPLLASWERPSVQARLDHLLTEAMKFEGVLAASLAVWELDYTLATRVADGPHNLRELRVAASAGNCRMMRAVTATLSRLDATAHLQDVVTTLGGSIHIFVPLPLQDRVILCLVIDGARSNLALTRIRVHRLISSFTLKDSE